MTAHAHCLKGCYLYDCDIDQGKPLGGIEKKVVAQIRAFEKAGLPCDFSFCSKPETIGGKTLSCLPFFSDGVHWPAPADAAKYSFLYIRRPRFASKELISFLKSTKELNPEIVIIYEVPTYPYDGEMGSLVLYPALCKDRKYRKRLNPFVDRVACNTKEDSIFDILRIPMTNGIDLEAISPKKPAPSLDDINVIVVANYMVWHGLDRFLAGMAEYYGKDEGRRNILLHVVGEGDRAVMGSYKALVEKNNLGEHVVFHGFCTSEELDPLYTCCSIAIESLGFHRAALGSVVSMTLKSREYLAKGIPMVTANDIDVFIDEPVDFCLKVPADDSPVDVQGFVRFHDGLYSEESQEELIGRIRAFAESHVGMDQAMQDIVSYIKETGK